MVTSLLMYRFGELFGRISKGTMIMKLAVFGANGPTGRLLTRLALDDDHHVVAFTRHPDAFPIEHRHLQVVRGDVHNADVAAAAIDGTDAVASTLGVPFAKAAITVYSEGAANIMAGMRAAGIKRLVCVTSSAVGPHPEPLGGFIFERIIQPYVVNKLGKTVYDDMRRMEAMVSASDLAWTIVRPTNPARPSTIGCSTCCGAPTGDACSTLPFGCCWTSPTPRMSSRKPSPD